MPLLTLFYAVTGLHVCTKYKKYFKGTLVMCGSVDFFRISALFVRTRSHAQTDKLGTTTTTNDVGFLKNFREVQN